MHARLIDLDSNKYTVEVLRKWKRDAEEFASQELGTDIRHEIINGGQPLTDIPMPVDLLGRDNVISEIKERLRENSIICITAVGGTGKSAVAAAICNDYKYKSGREDDLFKYVAWITSTGNLRKDLCKIELPQGFSTNIEEEKFQILYRWLADYEKSERYFKKALDIFERQLGEYNLHTVNTYDNLANMYCDWGRLEEALKYHTKALEFYEREYGEKDPETATAYNNIGVTYYKRIKCLFFIQLRSTIKKLIKEKRIAIATNGVINYKQVSVKYIE